MWILSFACNFSSHRPSAYSSRFHFATGHNLWHNWFNVWSNFRNPKWMVAGKVVLGQCWICETVVSSRCLWDVPQRSRDLKSFWSGLIWSNLIFVVTNHGNCLQFTVKGFQVPSNFWINFYNCFRKYKIHEYFGTISVPFDFFSVSWFIHILPSFVELLVIAIKRICQKSWNSWNFLSVDM